MGVVVALGVRVASWIGIPAAIWALAGWALLALAAGDARAQESTGLVLSSGAAAMSAQTVQATLGDLVSDPRMAGIDVAKLVVNGMASPRQGGAGTEVNVQWYSVGRLDGTKELPLPSALQSRFLVSAASVPARTRVIAHGNVAGLIAQARVLLGPEAAPVAGQGVGQGLTLGEGLARLQEERERERERDGSSAGKGNLSGGGRDVENPIAASYEPLQVKEETQETAAPAEAATYATTTDGCGVRIDLAQGVAVVQSRETMNGQPVSECTDTFDRFPLLKDYAVCPATMAVATATLRFKLYYEASGSRRYISECEADPGRAVEMQKIWDACRETVIADAAYRQYRLAFVNGAGEREFATECAADRSAPLALAKVFEGCAPEFDLQGETFRRGYQLTYTAASGDQKAIGGCRTADSEARPLGRTWSGCSEIVDAAAGTVRRGYRLVYADVDGSTREIGTCRPDLTAAGVVAVERDFTSCDPILDIDGGASTLAYQLTYLDGTGSLKALGGCKPDPSSKQPLARDFSSCGEKVDAASGLVTRQFKYLYSDKTGAVREVGECRPDVGNVLQVQTDYGACQPEIDAVAGLRRDRARAFYVKADGTKTWLSECKTVDTPPVPLSKDYEGCGEQVDMASLSVRRLYRPAYTERDGKVVRIGDCRPDDGPSGKLVVQQDHAVCDPLIDGQAGTRKERVRAYYDSATKGKTWIGECREGDAPPEAMNKAYDGCSDLVDEVALTARRQFQWSYIARNGSVQRVGSCRPDPDPSAEVVIREDYEACGPDVDGVAGTMRRQFVPYFKTATGQKQAIGGCIPGDNPSTPMEQTTDGCTRFVDITAGEVRRRYRFQYADKEGKRQVAGECRVDETDDGLVALERDFGSCEPVVNHEQLTVWPAYKRGHRKPDGSLETFGDCIADEAQLVPLLRNFEACEIRVDRDADMVFPSHLKYFVRNGSEETVGGCVEDAGDAVALERGYAGCVDKVVLSARAAYRQYRRFFMNRKGVAAYVDPECLPDTSARFPVNDDETNCSPLVDLVAGQVKQRTELVYEDVDGARVVVEECGARKGTAVWPVVYDTVPCSLVHDASAGRSVQQHRAGYERDGVVWPLGACEDSGLVYSHRQTEEGCRPFVDTAAGVAMRQSRTVIVTPDGVVEIAACQPIDGTKQGLQKTFEGCAGKFRHDMAAGVSYVWRHWYHTLNGGKTWVTECAEDRSVSYPHQTSRVGWDQNDATRMATEILWPYVDLTPNLGRHGLLSPQVLPTSAQVPYPFKRDELRPTGQYSVDGCQRYELTEKWEIYSRKDGSEAHYKVGPGEPIPRGGECGRQTERREVFRSAVAVFASGEDRHTVKVNACNGLSCIPFTASGNSVNQIWTWQHQGNLPGPYQICRVYRSAQGPNPECSNEMAVQTRQRVTQASGAVTYTDWVETGETRRVGMGMQVFAEDLNNPGMQ